ncbi:hypothetical protein [Amycolatopsis suaedae]|uniref:Uncharacterized protein n=1 Tax=Amycolatopsis suaedae TaxID=2510978 RepID=A0A4V2EL72_9PSEU|nr:hypothetical protein [Amycolatopsis suaedae]RZQ60555.1 hypothetical protein EWH70_28175 [Amycolatopsis suaedae]
MTPPPNRDGKPRRAEYLGYLGRPDVNLLGNEKLAAAPELGSWIEWLLYPEEHIGARTVIDEEGVRSEQDCNIPTLKTETSPPPPNEHDPSTMPDRNGRLPGWNVAHYYPYESVIERWEFSPFFGYQSAVSTQKVERPDALFKRAAMGLAAAKWSTDDFNHQITGVPEDGWKGHNGGTFEMLAGEAADILAKIPEILNGRFLPALAEYTVTIAKTRDSLNRSTGDVIKAFDSKLPKESDGSALAFAIAFIAGEVKGKIFDKLPAWLAGPPGVITKALMDEVWTTVLGAVTPKKETNGETARDRSGDPWSEIATSYHRGQADILAVATRKMEELTTAVNSARLELGNVVL